METAIKGCNVICTCYVHAVYCRYSSFIDHTLQVYAYHVRIWVLSQKYILYVIRDMGVIQNADTHTWETRGQTPNHV